MIAVPLAAIVSACSGSPADTPVTWFHDLQGGAIAAQRPPPPGAGLPYPHIVTVPAKPVLPDPTYRRTLRDQLMAQRDRTQRIAADTPIEVAPPPPPPKPVQAPPGADTAGAAATLDTADAPPPPPSLAAPANPASSPAPADGGPAPGAPVTLAGAAADSSGLPPIPAAPPPPATFEGVSAEPPPRPDPPVPTGLPLVPDASRILFPTGQATLEPSQNETLKDVAAKRGHRSIEITGGGEATSDSPDGQAAAIDLALRRAHAVATGLAAQHVPAGAIRLAAYAYGRGATVQLTP